MSEATRFNLDTADGKKIYGYHEKSGAARLVVLSHGLTSSPNGETMAQARRYFLQNNYDVVSFYYYTPRTGARTMLDATLKQHAADLNAVCDHFRAGYNKLFVAGHSYGGLAMIFARPVAAAYSFWDSTFVPTWWKNTRFVEGKGHLPDWGRDEFLGDPLYNEAKAITEAEVLAHIAQLQAPAQVVLAGGEGDNAARRRLYNALSEPKELIVVDNAEHTFKNGDAGTRLLTAVDRWFGEF